MNRSLVFVDKPEFHEVNIVTNGDYCNTKCSQRIIAENGIFCGMFHEGIGNGKRNAGCLAAEAAAKLAAEVRENG
jgi:hypothetical protein